MRTDEPAVERSEQLFDTRVDRVHLLAGNDPAPDGALIREYADLEPRGAQAIERCFRTVDRLDQRRIAVVRNVDDDGPVAID